MMMYSIAPTSMLLWSLSTMVSANIFLDGNEASSVSLFSKETRIIGGTEVSIEPVSFIAPMICTCLWGRRADAGRRVHRRSHPQAISHLNISHDHSIGDGQPIPIRGITEGWFQPCVWRLSHRQRHCVDGSVSAHRCYSVLNVACL